jgi:magnesium transporter
MPLIQRAAIQAGNSFAKQSNMSLKSRRRRAVKEGAVSRNSSGAPPEVLVPDPAALPTRISVLAYGPERHFEEPIENLGKIKELLQQFPVTWINVDGLGDVAVVQELGEMFNLHRLALEDVVHGHQRAKAEAYGEHYFVTARMPWRNGDEWSTEQISIFFGSNFVISFQEQPGGDCLEPVRKRIRSGWGRSKAITSDYLVYCLLDAIVDHYFPIVEECGERLDGLEVEVIERRAKNIMPRMFDVKRDLMTVRRIMWPLRDAINVLMRDVSPLISDETRLYLRDVHDHTIQIIDLVENYRDVSSGITEIHLASVAQRTNEIMRVLTIISTIFIPLTFIVGVYGMNFDHMPELRWRGGYFLIWIVMLAVAGGLVAFFARKGWLGGEKDEGSVWLENDEKGGPAATKVGGEK